MLSALLTNTSFTFKEHLRLSETYPPLKFYLNSHRISILRTVTSNVERDFISRSAKYMTTMAVPLQVKEETIIKSEGGGNGETDEGKLLVKGGDGSATLHQQRKCYKNGKEYGET
jgi:hypothetical protein